MRPQESNGFGQSHHVTSFGSCRLPRRGLPLCPAPTSLNVYFRDLQNVISVLILMLMLISPIAYKGTDIPATIMPLMYLNPLFYMIVCYQNCLLYGQAPPALLLGVLGVLAFLFFFLGFVFFTRLKRVFADNV